MLRIYRLRSILRRFASAWTRWHAEDLLTNPEVFLSGVEEGDFGKAAALELWIRLADQGYCKEGWWSAARADFVAMLDNYKTIQ